MNRIVHQSSKTVAALCKRHAPHSKTKEPEAPSTWRGHLARCLLIASLYTLPTQAQLDNSANGMSDIWERHFNDGELFDPENPDHLPQADPDGDGWTNLIESFAGTNPFDNKPPEGIVPAYVVHLKDQEEAPSIEFPEGRLIDLAIISWDTIPGKKYTLTHSLDLTANSWVAADVPHYGEGNPIAVTITLNQTGGVAPERFFWRVAIEDTDTDTDGLSDHEEFLLALNPFIASTHFNIPDVWLATHYSNLLLSGQIHTFDPNGDSDGDGISNLEELLGGTDPNTANSPQDQRWLTLEGDGAEGVRLQETRQFTIPAGQTALVIVAISSEEYPYYTDPLTEDDYNDILEWKIEQSTGSNIEGQIDVNSRHIDWEISEMLDETLSGLPGPVHYEVVETLTAPPTSPLTIDVEAAATNIGDGALPSHIAVGLLPVEVAVDADRNGKIEFGTDTTSETTPFRFWVNNDQDDVEADEPSVVETPDHTDAQISTKRDLEDFTRIRLSVGLPLDQLKNGSWKVGLRFKNSGGQSPSIRVWPNESETGEESYLDEHPAAERQIAEQSFGATSSGTVFIPSSYWQDRDDNEAHLIFEGISKGTGELALILQNGSESPEIEGPVVHLKLLDVREMFQRARIVNAADEIPNPWIDDTPPAQSWVWDPWNWAYDEDPEAEETTAIFVHGWRLTYYEYLNWAQTSYKRLWHQGFKGKFYTFRWATLSGDQSSFEGYLTYNPSEYRSWLCGPALASWVNSLPNAGRRSLFAHSMGNVITGSALREGMSVQRYALCNAAMASMAYDSGAHMRLDPDTGQPWDEIWGDFGPQKTPDTDASAAIRDSFGIEGKFSGGNNFPQMINFYLREDEALDAWVNNNRFFKPDSTGHSYYYQHIPQPPNISYKLFQAPPAGNPREVTSPPEAFGYVTKALTRTAGSDSRTGGSIGSSVNMNDWGVGANHSGFGVTHSAQWRWSNQSTSHFWNQLCEKLQLTQQE